MEEKKKLRRTIAITVFFFLSFSAIFPLCFSAGIPTLKLNKKRPVADNRLGSSAVFPIKGNVYPLGYYSVTLNIGRPPKAFELDIDTGSDLTWVQCDAPCTGCTKPLSQLYKPHNNAVKCVEPTCTAVSSHRCNSPADQCDYEIEYADHGASLGVLVNDSFPLKFMNGSLFSPAMVFGCGYDQQHSSSHSTPPTAGVLGLGDGQVSLVSQLHGLGMIQNVVGHCLSRQGGGFLFFGNDLVPSSGIVWTHMSRNPVGKHFSSGPAEVYFGGRPIGIKGLTLIFDSGSSYTYFNAEVYKTLLNLVKNDLKGKPLKDAPEDKSLPVCWKGLKPFKSIQEVVGYFNSFALCFTKSRNAQIQIPPEAYLIITKYGNACFGILNGTEVGLGKFNIIGDISLQDKLVIYDNEKQQIGWGPANCNRLLPKS